MRFHRMEKTRFHQQFLCLKAKLKWVQIRLSTHTFHAAVFFRFSKSLSNRWNKNHEIFSNYVNWESENVQCVYDLSTCVDIKWVLVPLSAVLFVHCILFGLGLNWSAAFIWTNSALARGRTLFITNCVIAKIVQNET